MRIKTFQADSMREVLRKVREELGENAVILDSRQVKGLLSRRVEITAAVDEAPPKAHRAVGSFQKQMEAYRRWKEQVLGEGRGMEGDWEEMARLREEVAALRRAMATTVRREEETPFSEPQHRWYKLLLGRGVDRGIVERWLLEGGDGVDWGVHERVRACLTGWLGKVVFPRYRGEGAKVVAFVGPTGMGKTTCLQKLAVRHKLVRGCRVALVSADTYRIGAMEQMRSFSAIAGMPLKVAYSPEEVGEAVESFGDRDVILVDTPGENPGRKGGIEALEKLVREVGPDELHLVLAANAKEGDLMEAVRRFGVLPVSYLLFTKLDETLSPGTVVNIAYATGKVLSYLSDGPRIPEDLHTATPERLAGILLEGGYGGTGETSP